MSDFKKFNMFNFLATFARSMIEVFVPIYLFVNGFDFRSILIFYLFSSIFSILIALFLGKIGQKIKYANFIFVSAISLILVYYLLLNITCNFNFLIIFAFCYVFYRKAFWVVKRFYLINLIDEKKSGESASWINNFGVLAGMTATLIGSIFLDNNSVLLLGIVSTSVFIISALFLYSIKGVKQEKFCKKEIKEIFKNMPIKNCLIIFFNQSLLFTTWFFPIYLYSISLNYGFIGIFNLILGLSSMIFVFLFAKKMDNDKKDHLGILIGIITVVLLIKLNITDIKILMIVALAEGYVYKMLNLSFSRNIWFLGKSYNKNAYNIVVEIILGLSRVFIIGLLLLLNTNLYSSIFILIIISSLMMFFKFDDGKGGYE